MLMRLQASAHTTPSPMLAPDEDRAYPTTLDSLLLLAKAAAQPKTAGPRSTRHSCAVVDCPSG
jgi:hypothetical protein